MGKLPAYCFGGIPVDSIKQSAFRMKILTPKSYIENLSNTCRDFDQFTFFWCHFHLELGVFAITQKLLVIKIALEVVKLGKCAFLDGIFGGC